MSVTRRGFLGAVAAGAAAAGTSAWTRERSQGGGGSIKSIGLQLYTVRTEMGKDFEGTLAKVAATGYKEVEFAGYFDKSPQDVKATLARHGLTSPSTHIAYTTIADSWDKQIEASKIIGHRFIVIPYLDDATRSQPDAWKKVAAALNKAGEATKKAGIQLAYHNHNFEFVPVNGMLPYDFLLAECDPGLVKMEMDLCWIIAGGQDPLAYFRKYPGRFPMVHVKDLKKRPASASVPIADVLPDVTEVGSGVIDWKSIFSHAKEAGIEHYFVEHDQPAAPLSSIATSFKYLQALRF
jgi:sugar phosphate isomerase/epimerase